MTLLIGPACLKGKLFDWLPLPGAQRPRFAVNWVAYDRVITLYPMRSSLQLTALSAHNNRECCGEARAADRRGALGALAHVERKQITTRENGYAIKLCSFRPPEHCEELSKFRAVWARPSTYPDRRVKRVERLP